MEEGVAFCPHCGAPQIRVIVAEAPSAPAILPNASGAAVLPNAPAPTLVLSMPRSAAFRSCALAAALGSLLMTLGLYPLVAILSAGFLAVVLYRQRWPGSMITPGTGVRLGALSGLLWFAITSIAGAIFVLFAHKGPEIRTELIKRIDQVASQTTDPQTVAMLDRLKTPAGLEWFMIASVVLLFLTSIVLAIVGGAIGGALFRRQDRR